MVIITDDYAEAIKNSVRDKNCYGEPLKEKLYSLGIIIGQKIAGRHSLEKTEIFTPFEKSCSFNLIQKQQKVIIVSTNDDYDSFGKGIASIFPNSHQGYIDFGGKRGEDALNSPVRSITLPDVSDVEIVIVAKAVLATGCTAISLIEKAINKYWPKKLIISSVFYSLNGCTEIMETGKVTDLFVIGSEDNLRKDGLLDPGVGILDDRLNHMV